MEKLDIHSAGLHCHMSATIVTSSAHTSVGQGILRHSSPPLPHESSTQATTLPNSESLSGFVNKPARGWLHPDHLFAKDGINYNVRVSNRSPNC